MYLKYLLSTERVHTEAHIERFRLDTKPSADASSTKFSGTPQTSYLSATKIVTSPPTASRPINTHSTKSIPATLLSYVQLMPTANAHVPIRAMRCGGNNPTSQPALPSTSKAGSTAARGLLGPSQPTAQPCLIPRLHHPQALDTQRSSRPETISLENLHPGYTLSHDPSRNKTER